MQDAIRLTSQFINNLGQFMAFKAGKVWRLGPRYRGLGNICTDFVV
jgi:hypothetical protein